VSGYLEKLEARLAAVAIGAPLLIMKSNGGVTSAREVRRAPILTALSGPAAGAVAARHVGSGCGASRLIAIDIGGTSADITLIDDGDLRLTTRGRIGAWPVGLPMVDIVTIGAGGGSAARRVIGERIAAPLAMSVEAAARGILAIVDNNMAGAIRVASVEQGHDPRDFALLAFGGAGPLHGGALARLLGMARVIVPPGPGVLSALGLLVSDLKAEFARTCLQKAGAFDCSAMAQAFAELEAEAVAFLDAEGVPAAARRLTAHASLRYRHQGFELFVPWAGNAVTERSLQATIAAFHRRHARLYTFAQEDTPVEIVTLRVDALGLLPAPVRREVPAAGRLAEAQIGTQAIALEHGTAAAAVYARERLGHGARIDGPAIITELDATTLLRDGETGSVDRYGNLIISVG